MVSFNNKNNFDLYLKRLFFLGMGSQGICYLDKKNKIVYKIFHGYFDDEDEGYTADDILKFSGIRNNTFIWPNDVVYANGRIIGYTMPYVSSVNLCNTDLLSTNLNLLEKAIDKSYCDIEILTKNNVCLYDVMYNILYSNGKINVIDSMEYNFGNASLKENMAAFDAEIRYFLVDNYFDEFVNNDILLREMYHDKKNVTSLEFLRMFRNKLSEYIGTDIDKLEKAKKLVMKLDDPYYIR
ncbi:MAG: hypothetical protein SO167_05915 [Bacilli bacterium]|nr:hypothetical protein [Bacilli bacterium]